jgi:hypothetical protein
MGSICRGRKIGRSSGCSSRSGGGPKSPIVTSAKRMKLVVDTTGKREVGGDTNKKSAHAAALKEALYK